jgi:SAM-dependent methyltransferase
MRMGQNLLGGLLGFSQILIVFLGYRQPVASVTGQSGGHAWRPDVSRAVGLWRAFGQEQSHPEVFYRALAQDSAAQVHSYHRLDGAVMVDVGGGPGFFEDAFTARGATYIAVDADAGEMRLHGRTPGGRTVQASGTELPFPAATFDVTYSSNVAEHVADPWRMADEMVRVTKPGGTVVLSYTLWWGPWGGHETAPWHYLGGHRAARRYRRVRGHDPKNIFGTSLFPVTAAAGMRWSRQHPDVDLIAAVPRYLPDWSRWILRVPLIGEVFSWNLLLVLRRRNPRSLE